MSVDLRDAATAVLDAFNLYEISATAKGKAALADLKAAAQEPAICSGLTDAQIAQIMVTARAWMRFVRANPSDGAESENYADLLEGYLRSLGRQACP